MTTKQEIIKRYDSLAQKRHLWKRRNKYYYKDQLKYFRFLVPEGLSVLELGCGTGDLLNGLNPERGVGIDLSKNMLDIAQKKYPHLEFKHQDIEEIKYWDEKFDVIIIADVIGHLFDIEQTLGLLHDFCKPETRLIISYYNFFWEPVLKLGELLGLKMPQQYQNWLSSDDISNFLTLSDFQVVKEESRLLVPKNIFFLGSVINRYFGTIPGIRKMCLCRYVIARSMQKKRVKEYSTTVLIPCRNEKGNIESCVKRLP